LLLGSGGQELKGYDGTDTGPELGLGHGAPGAVAGVGLMDVTVSGGASKPGMAAALEEKVTKIQEDSDKEDRGDRCG
jgi:hypothetical protein